MPDSVWSVLFIPIIVGLALSFLIEHIHDPRPNSLFRRRFCTLLIHCGLWIAVYFIEFVQFYRPWLAMLLANVIFYVFVLINHAKFRALNEPFIFQDFDYFTDAIKHPRLYLPFFGIYKIFLCLVVVGLTLWAGVSIEASLTTRLSAVGLLNIVLFIFTLAAIVLWAGSMSRPRLTFNAIDDFKQNGLAASIWYYWLAEKSNQTGEKDELIQRLNQKSSLNQKQQPYQTQSHSDLPNTIIVQSESFFDPRRIYPDIKTDVLKHFDQTCREAERYGTLKVPAWGANTVRTEFEFLTGINTEDIGINQFSPYRRLIDSNLISIARIFKSRGYKTICVHPYPASFYQRDKVFPLLGFDEFIDIQSFDTTNLSKDKPYISDNEVAEKVISLLNHSITNQPLFVYVITMENHGPLHLEHMSHEEAGTWFNRILPTDCIDLAIYLRHLSNADKMIERLKQALNLSDRAGQILWFGDHVPVMTQVYEKMGKPDGLTDYFYWISRNSDEFRPSNYSYPMAVHQLASLLLSNRLQYISPIQKK